MARDVSIFSQTVASLTVVGLKITFAPMDIAIAFKRQDVGRQAIQKPAVMADNNSTANKIGNRFLQRSQGVDIKIIGRFV